MNKFAYVISRANRSRVLEIVARIAEGWIVEVREAKRSIPQNDRLWASLTDVARTVEWAGKKRTPEAWKDIFTAALLSSKHELDVVPGINGGFVLLGLHTSDLRKAEFSELLELIYAFGAEHGVAFGDEARHAA